MECDVDIAQQRKTFFADWPVLKDGKRIYLNGESNSGNALCETVKRAGWQEANYYQTSTRKKS